MSLRREKPKLQGCIPWQQQAGQVSMPSAAEFYFRMYSLPERSHTAVDVCQLLVMARHSSKGISDSN